MISTLPSYKLCTTASYVVADCPWGCGTKESVYIS